MPLRQFINQLFQNKELVMNLQSEFLGIKSPNPFWLASAPPTDKEYNVRRAFEAGWGGVVWKTLGLDPNIVNVNGPRYGAVWGPDRRLLGMNNIELITDRPLQINLDEIKVVKKDYPDRAVVVSLTASVVVVGASVVVLFSFSHHIWLALIGRILTGAGA